MFPSLSSDYGYVIMVSGISAVQVLMVGFSVMIARKKVFNKEFFKENFPGIKEAPLGYPDMGSGYYANKLAHDDWLLLNNAMRAHYNYIEQFASFQVVLLLSGLFYPLIASFLGIFYIIGRGSYAYTYKKHGPSGRRVGALISDLTLIVMAGLVLHSGFAMSGGINGLTNLITKISS